MKHRLRYSIRLKPWSALALTGFLVLSGCNLFGKKDSIDTVLSPTEGDVAEVAEEEEVSVEAETEPVVEAAEEVVVEEEEVRAEVAEEEPVVAEAELEEEPVVAEEAPVAIREPEPATVVDFAKATQQVESETKRSPRRVQGWLKTAAIAAALVLGAFVAFELTPGSDSGGGEIALSELEHRAITEVSHTTMALESENLADLRE